MHEILSNLWYYILALVWAVYVSQELFVTGAGMLAKFYSVESKEYRTINESVGTHWDGIQVWVIVAIGGLFAVFYDAYALILSTLYIPFFLLLIAIILRGLSIELIYKSDDKPWQKSCAIIWMVSSFLLILVVGVYLTNIFIGLPINDNMLQTSFLTIFNLVGIVGGLFFTTTAITLGAVWIKLSCGKTYLEQQRTYIIVASVTSSILLVLLYLGFNHKTNGFIEGLFVDYPIIWIVPILSLLSMIISVIAILKELYVIAFITIILSVILLIFTGFSLTFPYIVYSTYDIKEGLLIVEASATLYSLKLMTISAAIFVPIVIVYQAWKYIKFWRR